MEEKIECQCQGRRFPASEFKLDKRGALIHMRGTPHYTSGAPCGTSGNIFVPPILGIPAIPNSALKSAIGKLSRGFTVHLIVPQNRGTLFTKAAGDENPHQAVKSSWLGKRPKSGPKGAGGGPGVSFRG